MRTRLWLGCLLCLLCAAGAWLLWHSGNHALTQKKITAPVAAAPHPMATAPTVSSPGVVNTNVVQISQADWNTNRFAGRLSNTARPIGQLLNDSHAILLANALIDTSLPLNFVFPKNLQPQGDPGAYIVQARGPIDNAFRAMLAQAGATIVSYIPNDAYLVRASASVAGLLGANPLTQAVIPYEPYYKIQSSLLYPAVGQLRLPQSALLKLGLFADDASATIQQIEKSGGQVFPAGRSPFGPVVNVIPPQNWTKLATLSGVQIVEPFHPRSLANDLSRAKVGVAGDSLTPTNYFNLTGSNIIVEVNDTGIDAQHPDLTAGGFYNRSAGVIGDAPQSLVDTNGHGTHVAGIIAGDGAESITVTNAPGSLLTNILGGVSGVPSGSPEQFRGMAPAAILYSVGGIFGGADTNIISDQYFQQAPALTNALISNNSWVYEGDSAYDLAAASYDAATRDALPFVTGSQPVLFVFAAGNAGDGSDSEDLGGGIADSIESPATAKNVITVGAVQEQRNITATVTNADGSSGQPWQAETATDYRVAGFSSRGNVGIGIEGTFGRYKPDVCAPGTFVISTRSEQWDIGTYFYQDPTNNQLQLFTGFSVKPGSKVVRPFPTVPTNAVQLIIETFPNANSPFSFAILPTLIGLFTAPGYQFMSTNDPVLIPPAVPPEAPTIPQILASGQGFTGAFNFAISNDTPNQVIFDLLTDIVTTNGTGNYFEVLSNLDQSIGTLNSASTGPGPYYRYESGTSMATPAVSGTLALMQEFYAVAFGTNPSPAMLKAMLINGAQATGLYTYQVQNTLNYEGWGLVNLPGSLPPGTTNQLNMACSTFIQDQSPTNALATGDSQTWMVATTNAQPLRVTLAWTDPPGDPAAAIKLVNNLALIVTNLNNPTNPIVYYGNDIGPSTVNNVHHTNDTPVIDTIDNVQNVYLPLNAGTNFSVTVLGYRVNVNAVTAQTNNVVQDYALVISCGNGSVTNAMTVTAGPPTIPVYPPTDQLVSVLTGTNVNAPLLNQFVGANTPLLGTNTVVFSTTAPEGFGPNNWQVTVGMTNQWHFYVVTNTAGLSNAAFITFNPNAPDPDTLSVPRMGVFGSSVDNATRDADIDLYVTTDPGLTNLDPNVISNCVLGTQIGAPVGPNFAGASLMRGTTEFVVDTNSQSRTPDVYYIGVKSEDQEAAEYGFISIFSRTPFSSPNANGQTVNGVPVPVSIPDGSPKVPGKGFVFGLALYPMQVGGVTVSNNITHENFGDLIGTLTLNGSHADVLNNHDSFGSPPNTYGLLYDDSAGGGLFGSRPSDGPGSLINYMGRQAIGLWQLTEVDDSLTQTGAVNSYTVNIQRYQNPTVGVITNFVPGGSWVFGFIDVPPGATNLTIFGTNITRTANPPVELFVKFGTEPTLGNFDGMAVLNPNGVVSLGPPLVSGRYFFGLYNPNPNSPTQEITLFATIGIPFTPAQTIYSSTDTPKPILDDAVTTDAINVPDFQTISALDVAISVQHPRISDLVFHLISPDGTRVLLMENRGGTDPNGAGGVAGVTTNNALASSFEGAAGDYGFGQTVGGWTVTANQVSVQNDPANASLGTSNYLALANGTLSANLTTVPGATYTLKFAYRGPNAVGWWRGESNTVAVDSIYRDNGTLENVTFTNGEVGSAFALATGTSRSSIGDLPLFYLTNSLSIEGWIYPSGGTMIFWRGDIRPGFDPYFLQLTGNELQFTVENQANTPASVLTSPIAFNQWYHVAATLDGNTGTMSIYTNGLLAAQINTMIKPLAALIPADEPTIGIGNVGTHDGFNIPFVGDIDEISLYSRALSASEVQAIYNDGINGNVQGGNGKFDTNEFAAAPPQSQALSLAEAQLSLNGVTTNIFGNNTNWQTYTVSFKATQTTTPLQIQGIEPGMLLDAASVTAVITNYSYLVFTENTNLTTTPIKFATPPLGKTNSAPTAIPTNVVLVAGPIVNPANGHVYYLLGTNTWIGSEAWAEEMGAHLATINDAAENNWISNTFLVPQFQGSFHDLWVGLYDPVQGNPSTASDYVWVNGEPVTYTNWRPLEPSNIPGEYYNYMYSTVFSGLGVAGQWNNVVNAGPGSSEPPIMGVVEYVPLTNGIYYLPEQSLDTFDGLDALGTWTLEVQDDRAGATNPEPLLLSWQLRFNYVTTGMSPNGIPSGPQTNVIPAGSWAYYPVNVPTNADTATNILLFATGPLNVWFNSVTNPIGINPPDTELLAASTGGSATLSTFSVPTNIVPGGVYYIGLYNPNAVPVTAVFEVNFHYFQIQPGNPGVPITNVVAGAISGDGVNYYSFTVPPNVDYVTNLLVFSTTPVNVWFNQTKPPVCLSPPDSLLISNATNGVFVLSANSTPPLVPGATYNIAIQNTNGPDATNVFEVNFHIYTSLTNGVPTTNSVPPNSFAYYTVTVPTNADYATNLLLFATTNLNVWFNQYAPPIGLSPADSLLISNATNGVSILSATSAPPLVPGSTYYLGVQNTNAVIVNFGLEVDFHFVFFNPITGPTITQTNSNGTNGFLLQWSGPTNYQYTIQYKTNLAPALPWNTVVNPVVNLVYVPPNGHYSWLDDGSLTGGRSPQKFYRIVADLLAGPITNSVPNTNIVVSGTITPLTVTVPANALAATNVLISASGPVDVWFNQTAQPTGNTGAGDVLMISTNTTGTFVLTGSSVPPLVPGANYYLGVQSLGTSNVLFVFQVNFAYASTNPPSIGSITVTNVNGTNNILLRWTEPTNYQFQVEWATNLAPAIAWHTIPSVVVTWSGIMSPTNAAYGLFQYLDDGSLTGGWQPSKFYRLIEYPYSTPIPQTLTIINTAIIGNAVRFQWVAPTNYQYSVLWTTNLGLPLAGWSVLANPALGLSNGVYTFTDTNQTGPATSPKFFRVREQ